MVYRVLTYACFAFVIKYISKTRPKLGPIFRPLNGILENCGVLIIRQSISPY